MTDKSMNDARLIDSHCHLTLCKELEVQEHLRLAREAGVAWTLDAGTHPEDYAGRYEQLKAYPQVFMGVAWAPHHADRYKGVDDLKQLTDLLDNPATPVHAISEIGVDYFYWEDSREQQLALLEAELQIAYDYDLPVFFHLRSAKDPQGRNAYEEAIEVIKKSPKPRGSVHCFTGSKSDAKLFLDEGYLLSFSGIVTYKSAKEIQEVMRYCPSDRILVETDAPYLAPVPHRGKKNQSAFAMDTLKFMATERQVMPEDLIRQCNENFMSLVKMKWADLKTA